MLTEAEIDAFFVAEEEGADDANDAERRTEAEAAVAPYLAPFGVSPRRFLAANPEQRRELVDLLAAGELRRLLARVSFLFIVGLGFSLFLSDRIRVFALAALALKGGVDLATWRWRSRALQVVADTNR